MTGVSTVWRSWLLATVIAAAVADQYEHQLRYHRFDIPQHLTQQELQLHQQETQESQQNQQFEKDIQQSQLELHQSPEDLQVADSTVHHKRYHGVVPQVVKRLKRQAEQRRQRRDYIQWYGSTTTYQQPNYIQSFQIQSPLPYFVPVWGNPRRIPIFFPPKPILFNPGYPALNPPNPKPSVPKPTTTEEPVTEDDLPITIGSRINVNEAGEPIWGIVEVEPSNTVGGATRPQASPPVVSGNRPRRPPTPPLLHRPSNTDNNTPNNSLSDRDNPNIGQASQSRPQQQVPPVINFRPQSTTTMFPPRTTRATMPTQPPAAPQGREEPPRCVWAIISCCNPTNTQISYNCFEQLGCPGAFWDNNPCSRENTAAALNTAAKFYEQK